MGEAGESPALSRNGNTSGEVRYPALYDPNTSWKGKLGIGLILFTADLTLPPYRADLV